MPRQLNSFAVLDGCFSIKLLLVFPRHSGEFFQTVRYSCPSSDKNGHLPVALLTHHKINASFCSFCIKLISYFQLLFYQ